MRSDPNIVVPFIIYECTSYYDKNRPNWQQMQKLAIHVSTGPIEARRLQGRRWLRRRPPSVQPPSTMTDDNDDDNDGPTNRSPVAQSTDTSTVERRQQ